MNLHARQGQDADTENEHADTGQGREGGRDRRLGFQYRLPSVQSRQLVGLLHTAGSSAQVGLLYTTGSSAQVGLLYTAGSSALVGPAVYHRGLSPSGPAVTAGSSAQRSVMTWGAGIWVSVEGGPGGRGYIYTYSWFTSLCSRS